MRLGLQSRYNTKIRSDHPVLPWIIKHSAFLINVCKVGDDGRTAHERRRGKRFNRTIPEFGESVWYLKPLSVGRDKLDTRWESGIFVGIRDESGELIILTESGANKRLK